MPHLCLSCSQVQTRALVVSLRQKLTRLHLWQRDEAGLACLTTSSARKLAWIVTSACRREQGGEGRREVPPARATT